MKETILRVNDMSCMHCVNSIKESLKAINGVSSVKTNLEDKKIQISHDYKVSRNELIEAIQNAGYETE